MAAALRASVNVADLPISASAAVEISSVGPTNCQKICTALYINMITYFTAISVNIYSYYVSTGSRLRDAKVLLYRNVSETTSAIL